MCKYVASLITTPLLSPLYTAQGRRQRKRQGRQRRRDSARHIPPPSTPQSDANDRLETHGTSYEEEYQVDAPMSVRSQFGHGYTFPFVPGGREEGWCWVSETGWTAAIAVMGLSDAHDGLYSIAFLMMKTTERNGGTGLCAARFSWRTITVGEDLRPIVETTVPWMW